MPFDCPDLKSSEVRQLKVADESLQQKCVSAAEKSGEVVVAVRLRLIHCKFTTSQSAGERIRDVVEVCSQAIRSSRWSWRFEKLCTHLMRRETSVLNGRSSRFRKGTARDLRTITSNRKNKRIDTEIVIVQPGLSVANITPGQTVVLASTRSFLLDTILTELLVVCSV